MVINNYVKWNVIIEMLVKGVLDSITCNNNSNAEFCPINYKYKIRKTLINMFLCD